MSEVAAETDAGCAFDPGPKCGGSRPIRIDRRRREWRRVEELTGELVGELNAQLTSSKMTMVRAAAELQVAAELERAKYLEGASGDIDRVVRAENVAARAIARLYGHKLNDGEPTSPSRLASLLRTSGEAGCAP